MSGSATKTLEHGRSRRMITPLLTSSVIGAPVGETTCEAQRRGVGKTAQAMAKASASVRMSVERRFMLFTGLREFECFGVAAAHQIDLCGRLRGGRRVVRPEAEIGRLVVPGDRRLD